MSSFFMSSHIPHVSDDGREKAKARWMPELAGLTAAARRLEIEMSRTKDKATRKSLKTQRDKVQARVAEISSYLKGLDRPLAPNSQGKRNSKKEVLRVPEISQSGPMPKASGIKDNQLHLGEPPNETFTGLNWSGEQATIDAIEPLRDFEITTLNLPRTTEAERLVIQRVGQDIFRESLLRYWEGRCAVTGVTEPHLLRASHIKPWSRCESNAERLDVYNGLLLAAHLDAAFDAGLISFSDDGTILFSTHFPQDDRDTLGISDHLALRRVAPRHLSNLAWHRQHLFGTLTQNVQRRKQRTTL